MHRFYCSSQNISGNKIIISDSAQVHHIKDVLRLKTEDEVVVFDGQGNEYSCLIEKISQDVILAVKERQPVNTHQSAKVTIACAIPKKSKFDDIVDKLTQVGVDVIIPLLTGRVIVKFDKDKQISRHRRWQEIALSASKQCQRNTIPAIEPVKNIKDVLSQAQKFDLKLIPTLALERQALKDVISKSKAQNILVLIGPEGDFTPQEAASAIEAGFIPVTLGDLVFRVETAAVAVASFIRLYGNH